MQSVELVADEQRGHEHRAVVFDGEGERVAERALVGRDQICVVLEQSLAFPFLEVFEGEASAHDVGASTRGRHDLEPGGFIAFLAHPDRGVGAGERLGRIDRRRVDPVAVRRGHEC